MCRVTTEPRLGKPAGGGKSPDQALGKGADRRLDPVEFLSGEPLRRHVLLKAAGRAGRGLLHNTDVRDLLCASVAKRVDNGVKRTVVIDLDLLCSRGIQICSLSGEVEHRVWPRPNARAFLDMIRSLFRIAVWSKSGTAWAHAVLAELDPNEELLPRRPFDQSLLSSSDLMPTVLDDGAAVHPADVIILAADRLIFGSMSVNVIEVEPFTSASAIRTDDVLLQLAAVLVTHLAYAPSFPSPSSSCMSTYPAASPAAGDPSQPPLAAERMPPVADEIRRLGLHLHRYGSSVPVHECIPQPRAYCQPVSVLSALCPLGLSDERYMEGHDGWAHLEFLDLAGDGDDALDAAAVQLQGSAVASSGQSRFAANAEQQWADSQDPLELCDVHELRHKQEQQRRQQEEQQTQTQPLEGQPALEQPLAADLSETCGSQPSGLAGDAGESVICFAPELISGSVPTQEPDSSASASASASTSTSTVTSGRSFSRVLGHSSNDCLPEIEQPSTSGRSGGSFAPQNLRAASTVSCGNVASGFGSSFSADASGVATHPAPSSGLVSLLGKLRRLAGPGPKQTAPVNSSSNDSFPERQSVQAAGIDRPSPEGPPPALVQGRPEPSCLGGVSSALRRSFRRRQVAIPPPDVDSCLLARSQGEPHSGLGVPNKAADISPASSSRLQGDVRSTVSLKDQTGVTNAAAEPNAQRPAEGEGECGCRCGCCCLASDGSILRGSETSPGQQAECGCFRGDEAQPGRIALMCESVGLARVRLVADAP